MAVPMEDNPFIKAILWRLFEALSDGLKALEKELKNQGYPQSTIDSYMIGAQKFYDLLLRGKFGGYGPHKSD